MTTLQKSTGLLLAGLATTCLLTACGGGEATPAATVTVAATTPPTAPAAPAATTAAPADPAPAADDAQLNGLPCHDLQVKGVSYAQAVRSYHDRGEPDAMDADHNGVPCETVYSASAVAEYYGSTYGHNPYAGGDYLGGMTCAQLSGRGFSYLEAASYWYSEGEPSRMDEDGNGRPCETVYSAAQVRDVYGY